MSANVLYLINHAGSGGTESYLLGLAKNYKAGAVHFIFNEPGRLCERISELGIKPVKIALRHPLDIPAALKIARYCSENDIGAIHAQFTREAYIALLAKIFSRRKIKIIYTCHIDADNNTAWKIFNSLLGNRIDSYVAVCNSVRRTMIKNGFPAKKIRVIFNGADAPPAYAAGNIREELGLSPDTFLFATLTRFTPEKGSAFLLEAVRALKKLTGAPFKVLIAGEGPLRDELIKTASELGVSGEAVFLGYRNDAGNILESADAYLNTSESECLSVAILEAMSRGLPVIATDAGGNIDLVNEKTGCGFTVKYGGAEEFASKMLLFINDKTLVETFGENAKRAVESDFNAKTQRALTYALYEG